MAEWYSTGYMYQILMMMGSPLPGKYTYIFIHASVKAHLGCFCVLAIVNSAIINTGMHIAFQIIACSRYMPRGGIVGSFVQFTHSVTSDSLWPQGLQHARFPCPSPTLWAYSNSHPLSRWCYPTISSSFFPFSSCLQSFPASGSYQMSQFFISGDLSIGVSASASVLPMNIQDWFPLGLTGWISLQSKELSRVFSNTTVQKHQFFGAQLSL